MLFKEPAHAVSGLRFLIFSEGGYLDPTLVLEGIPSHLETFRKSKLLLRENIIFKSANSLLVTSSE